MKIIALVLLAGTLALSANAQVKAVRSEEAGLVASVTKLKEKECVDGDAAGAAALVFGGQGAAIGFTFGPIGSAVGGVIGAGVGALAGSAKTCHDTFKAVITTKSGNNYVIGPTRDLHSVKDQVKVITYKDESVDIVNKSLQERQSKNAETVAKK